jgi:hypothetical protein
VGERLKGETNPEEIVKMITGAIFMENGQVKSKSV